MTATGPGGQKIIFQGGKWVPIQPPATVTAGAR